VFAIVFFAVAKYLVAVGSFLFAVTRYLVAKGSFLFAVSCVRDGRGYRVTRTARPEGARPNKKPTQLSGFYSL
ncbi:hypothetical protein WMW71_12500, partial [Flavobacterium buctense]